jgi:hypothetical protein
MSISGWSTVHITPLRQLEYANISVRSRLTNLVEQEFIPAGDPYA